MEIAAAPDVRDVVFFETHWNTDRREGHHINKLRTILNSYLMKISGLPTDNCDKQFV